MRHFGNLSEILESFLGETKNGVSDNGQIQFCCPNCADNDGLDRDNGDGKFNLEINLLKNRHRCWRCSPDEDMSGRVSKLIKRFGNDNILHDYYEGIKEIKKSK